jgi:magnesium and cobalt exporter, CNNM family
VHDVPISALLGATALLLGISAFFSISETSMMALNRYRLKHLAQQGHRGARLTTQLLTRTDRLLGVILLGNNLVNAAAAVLVAEVARMLLGDNETALAVATGAVTFAILVFAEITPKIMGAAYPEKVAYPASYVLTPLLKLSHPVVWFVNLFVKTLLFLLRLAPPANAQGAKLSLEELRTLVLEAGHFIPQKHYSILVNLFELEDITVDDVMIPRSRIEAIDLEAPLEELRAQIATSHHTRLVAYSGQLDNVAGVLHVRKALNPVCHPVVFATPAFPRESPAHGTGGGRIRGAPRPRHPGRPARRVGGGIHHASLGHGWDRTTAGWQPPGRRGLSASRA